MSPTVAWLIAASQVFVIAASYRVAADGGSPTLYYGVFWLGVLVMVAPFAAVLLSAEASVRARTAAVVSLGVVSFVPKFLRNPYGPLYHDELAHSRAVADLLTSHQLYEPNPTIRIIGDFPGLHIPTATLQGLTGLPFWAAASLLLLAAHTASLVAVLRLARAVLPDQRAAGLAALLYGLNPSYLYFDTQFAYESLAICLFLWVLALTVAAVRTTGRARGLRLTGVVVLILACVPTHHLTSLALVLVAAIACLTHVLFRRLDPAAHGQWRPWGVVLVTAVGGLTAWMLTVASSTFVYLRPYLGTALDQLLDQASGAERGRRLYEGSVQPLYERLLGMAAPLTMLAGFLLVVWSTRLFRGWGARRTVVALGVFGSLYFASVPFILAPKGAEGARRTWGFTYTGLAVCLAGLLAVWLWRSRRRWATALVPVALAGLLVGNTGAGLNDPYRFPGPYEFGSDTRSLTVEVLALAEEFGRSYPGERVVSDRYTNLALAAYGQAFTAAPSAGFRTYELFLEATDPDPYLVYELTTSGYTYLVVDERLSKELPTVGTYFWSDEPITFDPTDPTARSPIPQEALDRFETVPWATKVLATTNYSVYRLDFASVGTPQCDRRGCRADGR